MANPKVLVLGLNFEPETSGIAPYTTSLVRGLRDRGFRTDVITAFPHYPEWRVAPGWRGRGRVERLTGGDVTRIRHYVPATPTGARRAFSELTFGLNGVTRRWGDPDLVICPSPALLAAGLGLIRAHLGRARPAVGVVVQDLYSVGSVELGTYGEGVARSIAQVERCVLRRADGIVAIHDRFKRRIVEDLDVGSDDVTVIRNWTHIDASVLRTRAEVRNSYGWGDEEHVVLHTGAMGEKQALMNVVEAARLADQAALPVRFVLVGNGGQREDLLLAGQGVKRLEFLPSVDARDYSSLLAAADLLLVNERPGVTDMAVPSKLTSYFSSGVAVLAATDTASTTSSEIASSGAGLTVAPGDPTRLLQSVLNLAGDRPRRLMLGANGPAYCEMVLSEETALDAYAEWVDRLIAKRTRRSND